MSQAPMAAPQSSGSPGTSSSESSSNDGGQDFGFDHKEALAEARRARQESSHLKSAFDSHKKETSGDLEVLRRIKDAVAPQEKKGPDPIAEIEEQLDYYLEQAMEAKQRGQPIPLTTNLAVRTFQAQIEQLKFQQEIRQAIAEIRGGVDHANSPDKPVNDMAYGQMENFLKRSLDSLYGDDPSMNGPKKAMEKAATSAIVEDLRKLQRLDPDRWNRLRRDPNALNKVVNAAVRSLVPPKAMHLIEQDQLQKTPMHEGELWAAFREAKNIKDPQQRAQVIEEIRLDILNTQQQNRRRRR